MLHNNIDIETFIKLLPLVSRPSRRSHKVIRIAKGYYKAKPKSKLFKWLKL
jgi:hypothetical protein